ncbi:MAG: BrnT family toxin [Rhodopseudomonas palustris]|nr:BrnT family toxin [Rhodopseudomonas palustris]
MAYSDRRWSISKIGLLRWGEIRGCGIRNAPDQFEWDEQKNCLNRAKHGIDFDDAVEVFNGPFVLRRSDRHDEERWTALGMAEGRLIVVAFTRRAAAIQDHLGATREEE